MVTIIILLILAGVTISLVVGNNGLFEKASSSKEEMEIAKEKEQISLAAFSVNADNIQKIGSENIITKEQLETELKNMKNDVNVIDNQDGTLTVQYKQTGRYYLLDETGKIIGISDTNPVIAQVEKDSEKITRNREGTVLANTQITGTQTYINFTIKTQEGYTAKVEPSLPFAIQKNGTYEFQIISTDKEGMERKIKHEVQVTNYVEEPENWIKFNGNSHIEVKDEIISQEKMLPQYTVACKVKIRREDQMTKNYMGIWGNHKGEKGIQWQFTGTTTTIATADFTPYYDKWVDLVRTYDAETKEYKSYIDGEYKHTLENYTIIPYEKFCIGTSYLDTDRQMIGYITNLKIWNKALTDEEVANLDLFSNEVNIQKEYVYANINLTSKEEVEKIGTFVGTDYEFKNK